MTGSSSFSGLAHVTLDNSDDELWIMEGVNGMMIAADVEGPGHFTKYPSDKPTVALQIPFKDGEMMEHQVLYNGVCTGFASSKGAYGYGVDISHQPVLSQGSVQL